ncbi:MAG: Fe-S cluster assembly protein SufE [Candidatus Endolissoclinum sp. TMED26]|nr:MAG: Fe-S cluster assembly protein SufE [Candidatus Endolissoclinum sp. TMED26]
MPSETIDEAQQALIEEFGFFDDWMQRYEYLIDLGRQLAPLDAEFLKDEFKLRGCQSQVWLIARYEDDKLVFEANSDAAIVSGLIAVVLRIYSNRTAQEIIDTAPDFIAAIGLDDHLSPTRKNGLGAMLQTIKECAQRALEPA